MKNQPETGRGRRLLRWGLIIFSSVVALAVILIVEEDWRGSHDWQTYKHAWEAKGEKFNWQAYLPPPTPDRLNFFKAPFFTSRSNLFDNLNVERPGGPGPRLRKGSGKWALATFTDLKGWQAYYRSATNPPATNAFPVALQPQTPAADVLLALSKYNPALQALRRAGARPDSHLPLDYASGFNAISPLISQLAGLKKCSDVLELRAVAELAADQSSNALTDLEMLFRVDQSIRNSPFLISHLVRLSITYTALQPIWEGLARHEWSDAQLAALGAELGQENFLNDYEFAMRGERAFSIASLEHQRRTDEIVSRRPDGKMVTNSVRFMPSAYFYRNELAIARMYQQWLLPLVNLETHTVSPAALQRVENEYHTALKNQLSLYNTQALTTFPALGKEVKKFAVIQADVDLARVACALERYRLARGSYPKSLQSLVPQFIAGLPHDVITGRPLHYRRTNPQHFVLYSVGWNGKDNGGKVALNQDGSVNFDQGDWVWTYPKK